MIRRHALFSLGACITPLFGCRKQPGDGTKASQRQTTTTNDSKAVMNQAKTPESETSNPNATPERPTDTEVAILAGGCFWGMEEILREIDGVIDTEVGYAGGQTSSPTYDTVKTGTTGHAESVRIVFDPNRLTFAKLLEDWFFRMHDPTTKNRQGNDVGTQYRSAIFATNPEQEEIAKAVIRKVDESGVWDKPIVTEVSKAGEFTPAESYHQDYLQKNPGGYTCHYLRDFTL